MRSLPLLLATLVLTGLAFVAVAQNDTAPREVSIQKPIDRQYDTGHCWELRIQALYNATNTDDPKQEAWLRTAEAYRLLDLEGQTC